MHSAERRNPNRRSLAVLSLCVSAALFGWTGCASSKTQGNRVPPNLFLVYQGKRAGFIDAGGKLAIPCQYEAAREFSEGRAAIRVSGRWGYIDPFGRQKIALTFDRAMDFHEGKAGVCRQGRCGYIDINGREVVPFQYLEVGDFHQGRAVVSRGEGQVGFIDGAGNPVGPQQLNWAGRFSEERAAVQWEEDGLFGFVDLGGRTVISAQYASVGGEFAEGLARVVKGNHWGFVDLSGREQVAPRFAGALDFSEGLAPVELDANHWAFIDRTGKVVFALPQAGGSDVLAYPLSEGLAPVAIGERWGYVDRTGSVVIQPQFRYAFRFRRGLAQVELDGGGTGYIARDGSLVWRPSP